MLLQASSIIIHPTGRRGIGIHKRSFGRVMISVSLTPNTPQPHSTGSSQFPSPGGIRCQCASNTLLGHITQGDPTTPQTQVRLADLSTAGAGCIQGLVIMQAHQVIRAVVISGSRGHRGSRRASEAMGGPPQSWLARSHQEAASPRWRQPTAPCHPSNASRRASPGSRAARGERD